jgi:hypothetical protein
MVFHVQFAEGSTNRHPTQPWRNQLPANMISPSAARCGCCGCRSTPAFAMTGSGVLRHATRIALLDGPRRITELSPAEIVATIARFPISCARVQLD